MKIGSFTMDSGYEMAKELFEELKKRNIYVRYFTGDRVKDHLRITIGTDEEMERFYEAVREIQGA